MEATTNVGDLVREPTGPVTLAQVMQDVEHQVANGHMNRFRPLATGFAPFDGVLTGGLRLGDLLVVGGPFGVGKTILGLQVARNVVASHKEHAALYVCFEHDREHLMLRLLCLESAEKKCDEPLTLPQLAGIADRTNGGVGLVSALRRMGRYNEVLDSVDSYSERLVLAKADGNSSTLEQIHLWAEELANSGCQRLLVVIDYLQKIPVHFATAQPESELTTHLGQGLKNLAMSLGVCVFAIAASDRVGLQSKRMRMTHLRGSSALQYEADVGVILNNKYDIVSRDHLVFNPPQGETMRNWVVMSIEKNRSGRGGIDMEYELDAAHFRIVPSGRFVRERLVDGRVVLE